MATPETDELVEAAAGAFRERGVNGDVRFAPAWWDLDEAGRRQAFEAACLNRVIEGALDPQGLSSTARAVVARLRRG
jgi:hypothetical protein